MVLILPARQDGLAKVEAGLSQKTWSEWTGALKSREDSLRLPRFKLTSQFELNDALAKLGMPLAFDAGSADFSGMDGKHELFISSAIHQAFVDVNEQGSEAAAATAIVAETASAVGDPQKPEEFYADHPFLFGIVDNRTNSVLFLGRVTNPRQ
jgi:serpin B